jgi:hypothetical protein
VKWEGVRNVERNGGRTLPAFLLGEEGKIKKKTKKKN